MSFIAKSFFSYFSFNKNKNKNNSNENNNNNDDLQNLFKTTKKAKQTKIFSTSTSENNQNSGIFKNIETNGNSNIKNIYQKKIVKNKYNNYNKNKEHSIGINFNGIGYIKSDNQNCIFMSITALPEYNYSSSEELRLADLEKKTTGNLQFYKIRNTLIKENFFSEENNNINNNSFNYENNLFNNDNFYNKQSTLFRNNNKINFNCNNEKNIFAQKPDITKSPFAFLINNNYNNNNHDKSLDI